MKGSMKGNMKVSLCMSGVNQSLLFSRALHCLSRQSLPREDWELIVIDDFGSEDWESLLDPYRDVINIRYFRLDRDDDCTGWRCLPVGLNFAFSQARGEILMETNSHLMLHPEAVEVLYMVHKTDFAKRANGRLWASLRGYTITREDMPHFDTVDWREDITNLKKLPCFSNPWTTLWDDPQKFFGTHLLCSIPRDLWFDEVAVNEFKGVVNRHGPGFPELGLSPYGADDCWYAGRREELGITSINIDIERCPFMHQDHHNHRELVEKFDCRSFLNGDGQNAITAPWWGQEYSPSNPDGLWPFPPIPRESYWPGSGLLPKLRPEFSYMYDMDWAEVYAPWLAKELALKTESGN